MASDTDSARQPTIDSGLDEAWREESHRYRHADVMLAADLAMRAGIVVSVTRVDRRQLEGGLWRETPKIPRQRPDSWQMSPLRSVRESPEETRGGWPGRQQPHYVERANKTNSIVRYEKRRYRQIYRQFSSLGKLTRRE
jgi:hypothetical protein